MGLSVDTTYGVPVVHHGGDMIGYHSDMIWLPEHDVGAVILTNGDPGWLLLGTSAASCSRCCSTAAPKPTPTWPPAAARSSNSIAAERKLLTIPADPAAAGKLAPRYANPAARRDRREHDGARRPSSTSASGRARWRAAATADGTISFITTVPGFNGIEFVVGTGAKRTLVTRDAQHEYVFEER